MSIPPHLCEALRRVAATLDRIDVDVYTAAGKDPLEPVMGGGDPRCRVCFFGRDPGRHEVIHGAPFVGAGGQKIRRELYQVVHGAPMPSFEASLEVGAAAFWANTVPYKPIGNKVWSPAVRQAFRPLVQELLLDGWQGAEVIALGREAFFWFAHDRADAKRFAAHWAREDGFETSLEVELVVGERRREVRLFPLPHPSPLNATWAPRFPGLLRARLLALGLAESSLVGGAASNV